MPPSATQDATVVGAATAINPHRRCGSGSSSAHDEAQRRHQAEAARTSSAARSSASKATSLGGPSRTETTQSPHTAGQRTRQLSQSTTTGVVGSISFMAATLGVTSDSFACTAPPAPDSSDPRPTVTPWHRTNPPSTIPTSTGAAAPSTTPRSAWSTSRPPAARRPRGRRITEIGAVKVRGGEILGEFQTLVNPDELIPAFITVLTGITDQMVVEAPRIAEVLPSFLEFARRQRAGRAQRPVRRRLPQARRRGAGHHLAGLRRRSTPQSLARRVLLPRRGAQLQAVDPRRALLPRPRPTTAPSPTPAPPSTCCTRCSSGSGRWTSPRVEEVADLHVQGHARAAPQAPPRRRTCPTRRASTSSATRATRSSTSARRATCAPACARTSPRPRPAPAWARWSCWPSASTRHRLRHRTRGPRARAAAHRPPPSALQPAVQVPRAAHLAQAHRRAVAAAVDRPRGPRRRRRLHRSVPQSADGRGGADGTARLVPHPSVHGQARRSSRSRVAVRPGRDGPLPLPVRRLGRSRRVRRRGRSASAAR